jgi:Luciferase
VDQGGRARPSWWLCPVSEWLRELVLSVGGMVEAPSRYKDDLAYWVEGREIAHLEAGNVLDLRLTRAVIKEFKDDPRLGRRGLPAVAL